MFVDSFTCPGSLITNDGSSSRDITSRIAKAASAMCHLSNPLFCKHRISIRTKINMYRALVVSVLVYGPEAWAITLADRRRLDVFGMRCQRRLLRVFWQQHVSSQSIRERTKQPTASSLLRQRRLRWFGYLHRMPSSLPVRRVFEFNPNTHGWKRPRGRPKTRWADSVKHDLHTAGLDSINAAQMVYDRPPVEGLCLRTANARTRASPLSQISHRETERETGSRRRDRMRETCEGSRERKRERERERRRHRYIQRETGRGAYRYIKTARQRGSRSRLSPRGAVCRPADVWRCPGAHQSTPCQDSIVELAQY